MPLFIDTERANAVCRSEGCSQPVMKPIIREGKTKQWVNYLTRCKSCQHLMHKYKITTPERDRILVSQDNRCMICNVEISFNGTKSKANVDHCHNSGIVRGILCNSCNTAIGSLRDDTSILQNAIKYLEKFK